MKTYLPFLLIVLIFLLAGCKKATEVIGEAIETSSLLEANGLKLLGSDALNFPTYHVQGLAMTEDIYFVTSIDRENERGWLFTVNRDTLALVEQKELTEGALTHPGGIELDESYLWIPIAEYDSHGPSKILGLNPQSLEVSKSFTVPTHISLIASNGVDRLYGTDWASAHFYVWDWNGNLIEIVSSPTSVDYQDCQFVDPYLICGGYAGRAGSIDILDPENWTLINRINVGESKEGNLLTREGLSFFDGRIYLLPDDGPESEVLLYHFTR
jgi:hypothetical protein